LYTRAPPCAARGASLLPEEGSNVDFSKREQFEKYNCIAVVDTVKDVLKLL
jgi:hypothetical protein